MGKSIEALLADKFQETVRLAVTKKPLPAPPDEADI